MNKAFKIALIVAVVLVSTSHVTNFSVVHASTSVSGIISADTTWTKANSPYNLTGPTAVAKGVVLTIEPGVTVNLNGYYILVNGTLIAKGASSDKIYINGGNHITYETGLSFRSSCSGCFMENVIFKSCPIGISNTIEIANTDGAYFSVGGGSPLITNNHNCGFEIISGSPIVSNNHVVAGMAVFDAAPLISNNIITGPYNNGDGIFLKGLKSTLITDNIIFGSFSGACISCGGDINSGGQGTIQRNLLVNNNSDGVGIYVRDESSCVFQNNTIANSAYGIKAAGVGLHLTAFFNNFQNVSKYTIYWDSSSNFNATYNWWGTTETQAINQSIHDNKNDFNLGKVTFIPFLTEPNPQAPPNNSPITLPLTSPTPTPTATESTVKPTSSPTTTATVTTSPRTSAEPRVEPTSIPESLHGAGFLIVLIATLLLAISKYKFKR